MDPVPMFVGDVDEARRHTVGVGLTLMEQPRHRQRRTTRDEKDNKGDDQEDDPWRTAARRGFHPVFDASFKRLILVVANGGGGGGGSGMRKAMRAEQRSARTQWSCGMHRRRVTQKNIIL